MKILLFGKNGRIGHELLRTLWPLGEIVAPAREDADFEDRDMLRGILRALAADVIVNAAGYTAVDRAETDEARAFRVNADAVEVMADYARYNGSLLVHYSTDYVFDGKKAAPYVETDMPAPLNAYGRSKYAGEMAVLQGGGHHFIFRTSWVYASRGENFVRSIWERAQKPGSLDVVSDQVGTPTSAELIADVTALCIAAFYADLLPEGVHHLTAAGETSRHNLACHIVEKMQEKGIPVMLDAANIRPVATSAYPASARRPLNSCLDNRQLCEKLGFALPDWSFHVDRALDQFAVEKRIP